MKTVALVLTLVLHASGLWPHISDRARSELTTGARIAAPSIQLASLTTAANALPVRLGTTAANLEPSSSVVAVDRATGTYLYTQNAGAKRPIASITKLVTVMVVLDSHQSDEMVTIGVLPTYTPDDERLGLATGEVYKLSDLVKAALISSDNDAADALAIFDAGSITKFAARMNAKMTQWGISDTHFVSPSGLQDTDNYATALSLERVAALALSNPLIHELVGTSSAAITSAGGRSFNLTTTNVLLSGGQFYGIKTGYTLRAGECFIGLTEVSNHEIITVVLGSSNRFGETQALVTWIGSNWQWL